MENSEKEKSEIENIYHVLIGTIYIVILLTTQAGEKVTALMSMMVFSGTS